MFKLLPLFHDVDTIDKVYRLLLGIVTSGRSAGYRRAMLFEPDEEYGVIRGRYGAEPPIRLPGDPAPEPGFEGIADDVFRIYETIESAELTLKARSYSVPLGWYRSALVKSSRSRYPVLAERGLSEFATDTFFDYFGTHAYIAVPIEFGGRVHAVLAADRGNVQTGSGPDDISVLLSLVHHASAAAQRLTDISAARRRSRVLLKIHQSLQQPQQEGSFEEGFKAMLAMICRAVGGSVCLVRDHTAQKTHVVEVIQDLASEAREHYKETAAGFDDVLDLSASMGEVISGDRGHPHLHGTAAERVEYFFVCPLSLGNDGLGALAVYTDTDDNPFRYKDFNLDDKSFLELCGNLIASGIAGVRQNERLRRVEALVEEVSSNLVREREQSRVGRRLAEFQTRIAEDIRQLKETIKSGKPAASRLLSASKTIDEMDSYTKSCRDELLNKKTRYEMTDLFRLTRRIVESLRTVVARRGIELTTRIPPEGPLLLIEPKSVTTALENVMEVTAACLGAGEKMMVECSLAGDRLLVCVADNGTGLPGDTISRLFMPFTGVAGEDTQQRALSAAGDVLQKHSAEIMVKSSYSWKTILIMSFPEPANRDRRVSRRDRRRRRDRRSIRMMPE
ncbi:MAG: hypothetical protein P8181_09740 [bacterium]